MRGRAARGLLVHCLLSGFAAVVRSQTAGNPLLPDATIITVGYGASFVDCNPPPAKACEPPAGLIAGMPVTSFALGVQNAWFPASGLANARISFVNTSVSEEALAANPTICRTTSLYATGPSVLVSPSGVFSGSVQTAPFGASTQLSTPDLTNNGYLSMGLQASELPLQFRMGGDYRVCYSKDGSFGGGATDADIVLQDIKVWGVYDSRVECRANETCMRLKKHRCYVMKEAYNNPSNTLGAGSSCVVDYTYDGAGFKGVVDGDYPRAFWSREFDASYTAGGAKIGTTAYACGTTPAQFLCHHPDTPDCDASDHITPEFVTGTESIRITFPAASNLMANETVPRFEPRTVAVCYCAYSASPICAKDTDYKQQVGVLMYYTSRVCFNHIAGEEGCDVDFTGASPQHRFSLRVECPPDGCVGNTQSRIKIVSQDEDNDQPSWATSMASSVTGCATAIHGKNARGQIVLPPDDNPDVENISGRTRSDFKIWNYKRLTAAGVLNVSEGFESGFMFDMGYSDYEKRGRGGAAAVGGETFDVCYCDGSCDEDGNWFKVGALRFVPFQLVSATSKTAASQEELVIQYANQAGMLGMYRSPEDKNVMGMREGGMLKLVSDLGVNLTDEGCKDDPTKAFDPKYDRSLVFPGPMIDFYYKTAYNEYLGVVNATIDPHKLTFNNGKTSNMITVKKAGTLAVCYCSSQTDGVCFNNQWVLASRLTIRGPRSDHFWHYSTHVVFRLEYEGWGLSSNDEIRIIPATAACQDSATDQYGPSGAYTITNIKLQCPYPCSEVGEPTSSVHGGISTKVLASDSWMCNNQNDDCRPNDIKGIVVLDESWTELEFEKVHGMEDGDLISITENVQCNDGDTPDECNDARVAVLKGMYPFADGVLGHQPANAPSHYFAGHVVKLHPTDPKKVYIPVGWPSAPDRPRFVITPGASRRGQWVRHSKAITKLEVQGMRALENLKVCWAYPTTTDFPKYTTQVGTITLEDPNIMTNVLITPTTLKKNQISPWAPMIVSFRTAGSETGRKYGMVQGPSQMRIFFTVSTSAVYATFGDGSVIDKNTGEDEIAEARQYICGKMFRELWSSDADMGFPMPKGCFYTVYGTTQEITVLFDAKNGLKAGQDYQMVMTGVFMDEAKEMNQYAEIFTMDDYLVNPYTAIERGQAQLARQPIPPAYGTDGVEFYRPDGVKVISRTVPDMMEMSGNNEVTLALKGQVTGGGIKAGAVLRIFLWPLTQWDVAIDCSVICIPYDDITSPCGAVQDCKGDALVPNFQSNYLRIVMPAHMSQITAEVSHSITISDLVFPTGGFFPTRFGVEVRRADDTKPDYLETVGNFFYKEPEDGASVGKLIEFYGDGDAKPFRGDKGNVLYAQLMLASTLFSAQQSGDAIMKVVLPEGYQCLYPETTDGSNPWQPPADLGVFGTAIPQGTGAPFENDAWSGTNNTCQYSLRQNGVVYAGSSLVIRITVNNPNASLKRTDPRNRWRVELTAKGSYSYPVKFPAVVFGSDAELGNFSSNKPVLGRLTEVKLVPQIFAASLDVYNIQMTWLRVFFRAEQDSGVDGQVRIVAASGFVFPDPCGVRDIPLTPFNYYSPYSPGSRKMTKRLPGIRGCKHTRWPGESKDTHIAAMLQGSILADTYYAFETQVQNPYKYDRLGRNVWQIFTADGSGYRVDGSPRMDGLWPDTAFDSAIDMLAIPSTAPAAARDLEPAFGLYKRRLDPGFTISSMMPSSLAGYARAQVSFQVSTPMNGLSSTLRITAPAGFIWNTSTYWDEDFLGIPDVDEDNVLFWNATTWVSGRTYLLKSDITVPDFSPQNSLNELHIEFGHAGATLDQRLAAGRAVLGPVKAMSNAGVGYTQNTNLEDPRNDLNLQFSIVTPLQETSYIRITGPGGFQIARSGQNCMPDVALPQRGSPYDVESDWCCENENICPQRCPASLPLPASTRCILRSNPLDPIVIDLIAGVGGMPAGHYRFLLQTINPGVPTPNPVNLTTKCGQKICWTFTSYTNVSDVIDTKTYTPAFPIRTRLVEAGLSDITDVQAAQTGRDDRPLLENSLVFFFKLTKQILTPQTLTVRAPQGYVFREDCLSALEVRELEVYGSNEPLASGDTAWPLDVKVLSCRGEGPNAYIRADPGIGQGFLAELRYPFRLKVFNPRTEPQPANNKWVIGYADESSRPFSGFSLWTFKRVTVPPIPASIGASLADSSIAKLWNPVTFTLAPHNTISGPGMVIRVTAPPFFQFANTALKSRIMVQPVYEAPGAGTGDVPPNPKWDARPSLIWGDDDIDAAVDAETKRILTATVLADTREFTAGRDYQVTVFVYNPMIPVAQNRDNQWIFETYNSPSASPVLPLFRDRIIVQGFAIQDTPRLWNLLNEEPGTGVKFYNGLQQVKQLYFEMQFPSKLETQKPSSLGDEIVIWTPAGYTWVNCDGTFQWEPPKDFDLYLPNSPRTCTDGTGPLVRSKMSIRIQEPLPIPAMRKIQFRVDARNPAKTPHVMLNHWIVFHYSGLTGAILSTTAWASWDIVPQLANVSIELIGADQNKAAGMQSRMSVSFTPVSDADQLELKASLPLGFDFTGCVALTNGHEVIATDLDTVRIRASVYAGVRANIIIDAFKLGQIGGPTQFDLITKLNNGEQVDESMEFTGGFELPGFLRVWQQTISSEYNLNPLMYPGQRDVRMSARATVKFLFTVTRTAEPDDLIALSSALYTVYPEDFTIRKIPANIVVSSEVVSYVDGSIVAQLRGIALHASEPGFQDPAYEVSVAVMTPNMPNAADAYWRIELRKPGLVVKQLPLDTNDARTEGFRLVENLLLELKRPPDNEAPPMAEVDVELVIDPKSTTPDEFVLMAPILFNFSADCLVRGGQTNEIASCTRIGDDPQSGRAQALLKASGKGLTAMTDFVVIRITTPAQDAAELRNRMWFLDARSSSTGMQLGWGEDPTGISIRQMSGAAVVFSSIPQISTQLAITFYTGEKVAAGGMIRVYYPRSIIVLCDGAFLQKVALEGDITCNNDARQGNFELTMVRPMPPGQQAFTVTATPPDKVDDVGGNIFKVMVFTPEGKVVDAAMNVPGNRIQHGITAQALELIWSSSAGGRASSVSLGFELVDDLPAKDPPIVSEIVVTVPPTIEQTVTRASHIENQGVPLPLRAGQWLDVKNPRQVKLLLDEQQVAHLVPGSYRFSFPIILPTRIPKYNIYHISLCERSPPGDNSTCSGDPQDPRVITTFPLAGFNLGEEHPTSVLYRTAGVASRRCGEIAWPVVGTWLALQLALVLRLAVWT